MKPRTYSDNGIVLARRNYGEADRILSIYTKNHGRISFIAKGIRRPESRKRGHLEIFSHIQFQGIHGKGIDILTEAVIVDNFSEVRKNIKRMSLAYYLMEVVGRTTHEAEYHPEIYDLLLEYLEKLEDEDKLKTLRLNFIYKLLTILGFWPEGEQLNNPDAKLEEVIERKLSSVRVAKRMLE